MLRTKVLPEWSVLLFRSFLCGLSLVCLATPSFGQFPAFFLHQQVPVTTGESPLKLPWAGGMNAMQYQTIDLDGDGLQDLVLFDRTTQRISTFLQRNQSYEYAPAFASIFPDEITFWLILADYDCDGQKDLFWGTSSVVKVLRNTAGPGQAVRWSGEPQSLRTLGFSGLDINLRVDVTDVPAIVDVDGDGDLDVLTFLPSLGGTVEYHQNMSMEMLGTCDTLVFEKKDDRWGGFEECGTCNTYLFENGESCVSSNERITHAGSAILARDLDGNNLLDLVIGEVACNNLVQMSNNGTPAQALFQTADFTYPANFPVDIFIFPSAFAEDVNFDGHPDLLVSPNVIPQEGEWVDFAQSSWLYRGDGNLIDPTFVTKAFLQEDMIDVGENARPTLVDDDGDGDLDLVVGMKGNIRPDGSYSATLWRFENTGTNDTPAYQLTHRDFLGLSALDEIDFMPQATDLNGDGLTDLVLVSRRRNSGEVLLRHFSGNAVGSFGPGQSMPNDFALRPGDKPYFLTASAAGAKGVLVARFAGALQYYQQVEGNWQLLVDEVGGVGRDFFRREPALAFADFDGEGTIDLLLADNSGELRLFPDLPGLLQGQLHSPETAIILAEATQPNSQFPLGRALFPVASTNGFLLGTGGGGLHYFKSTAPVVSSLPGKEGDGSIAVVQVFPNPAEASVQVIAGVPGQLVVFGVTGSQMTGSVQLEAGQSLSLDVSAWPRGLYLIKTTTSNGKVETRKLLLK